MSRQLKLSTLLFSMLFLYVQVAEAGLLRTSGRGSLSSNFSQDFYFVENQYLNEVGIIASAFDFGAPVASKSFYQRVGGGGRGLGAVPNDCINGYTRSDEADRDAEIDFIEQQYSNGDITESERDQRVDDEIAKLVGEPCVWEFEQGDALSMFGFFSLYFGSADVTYDVNWHVNGTVLPGSVNTSGDIPTQDGIIRDGWITLNTAPIFNLSPGDYQIYATVGLSSSAGKFFWVNRDSQSPVSFSEKCIDNPAFIAYNAAANPTGPAPDQDICGYTNLDSSSNVFDPPSTFVSEIENLRILAASSNPNVTPVNAPTTLGMLLLGAWVIGLKKRKMNK